MSPAPAEVLLLGYFGALILAAGLEGVASLHPQRAAAWPRWRVNISLGAINMVALAWLLPLPLITLAAARHGEHTGPLSSLPDFAAAALLVLAIDFLRYFSHRLLHAVHWFWPVHAPHHEDPDVDVSTGLRFHPVEAIGEGAIQAGLVWTLVPSAMATSVAAVVFALSNFLTHANVCLPRKAERWLRVILVTPDVHRVHHAAHAADANHNFAALLTVWDRMFATYQAPAVTRSAGQTYGIAGAPTHHNAVLRTLWLPWRLYQHKRERPRKPDSA